MKRHLQSAVAGAVVGLVCLVVSARAGSDAAAIQAIAKDLADNGELALKDSPIDVQVETRLKMVTIDDSNVGALTAQLSVQRKDPVNLYVINKLLQPLRMAGTEVVRRALPTVKSVHQQNRQYQQMPTYSAAQLAAFKLPGAPAGPAGALMSQLAAADKVQEQKMTAERPIAMHNEQAYQLEKNAVELMLLAEDPKEDANVVVMLVQNEAQKLWLYADICDLIRARAGTMSKERATFFHKQLEMHGNRLKSAGKKKYLNYGTITLSRTDNSKYPEVQDAPGTRLLTAVNVLATTAKLPAVKVP